MAGKSSTFQISLKLLTQQFNKGLSNVQKQLKSFGNFVKGAFGLTALVTFGRKVVETGAQFEDAMARVQAVSNATAREMEMMTKEAERLGATTKYTASEAANALENLTRNGMSASDATTTLSTVLKMAQANAIGLSESADIVSNTLNMFGLQAKDAEKVSDVLSATAANSATNITLLNEALVNAAPVANTLGMSLEETSAMIGALAQRGLKGAAAGTQMRMALIKMVDPSVTEKLKGYGVEIDEATIKSEGLAGVLKRLKDANLNMTQLTDIFKSRQASGIQQMIDSYDDLVKIMNVTENAAGTTARMFEQGVGSTENAIKSLQSAYEGFLNSIFKSTSGVLNTVLKGLTNLVRALSDTKTRTTAVIGAVVSLLTIKFVGAMNKVKAKALETNVAMTTLRAGITTVTAAAKAAYAAMGGWVGILVTLGSVILTSVVSSTQRAKEEMRDLAKAEASAAAEAETERLKLERLHKIAEDATIPIENRKRALEEMKKIAPDYLGTLDKEGRLINDNKEALDKYIESLQASLILKAREAHLNDLIRRKEEELQKAYEIEKAGPTAWDRAQSALSGRTPITAPGSAANPGTPSYMSPDDFVKDRAKKHYDKADELQEEINQYSKDKIDEAYQNYLKTTGNSGGGNGGGGGKGGDKKDTPDEKFFKAQDAYAQAISEARVRWLHNISTEEEYNQEILSAQKQLIDAYVEYAAAVEGIEDDAIQNNVLQGKTFKQLQTSYNDLKKAVDARAKAEKDNAKKEEKQNEAWKKLDEGLSRLDAKQGKTSIQNPWDNFSSNPKEYRDEEREVQRLQTELENLVSTYESLKDIMENIGEPQNDEQIKSLNKWKALIAEISEKTAEFQQKANALGSKKAMDEINQKTIDQRRAYYDTIRNTTSAVGQLASNLQSLADADWSTMSVAEKFNTISNAIFGTIDAVLNVIDTFRSLQEIIESLQAAKTSYALIEQATSEQEQKNAEAEGAAALAKGADELAAAQMSMIAGEVDKEVKRGVVAANSASAISGAAAAMASIPYVGPFLATAAATEMEALLAAMLPKFAGGGIIQGNSKYGDRLLARVNAGEMILNAQQQKRLFDIANGHGGLGAGQVSFHIAGKDLVGVLRNNNAANAKISGAKGL